MFKLGLRTLQYRQTHFSLARFSHQIKFTITDKNDNIYKCEGDEGETLMQVGLRAGVKFEVACGGNAECCTCLVQVPTEVI